MIPNVLSGFVASLNKCGGTPNLVLDVVEKSRDLFLRSPNLIDTIMDNYEAETHTCLHAALLRTKYSSQVPVDKELLIAQTRSFFEKCDPDQAQKVSAYVRAISQEFTDRLIGWGIPRLGISPLLAMIPKLQRSPEQLTAIHGDVCQLALAAKMFRPVLPLLDVDILEVDKTYSVLDAKDYLMYFYYGGLIYATLKMWARALHFFELCLIIPTFSLSCILIETVKKIILVSLIHHGKFNTASEGTGSQVMTLRAWKLYGQAYLQLALAFKKDSPDALLAAVETHRNQFVADCNFGLVKQVLKSHVKFRIRNLTKTFMTLSLSDVATRVKLSSSEEAEQYLVEMIESKEIFALINQRDGTVHFHDDPEQYNSLEMLMKLQKQIEECMALEKHLIRVSDQLVESPHYAEKMLELENKGGKTTVHY